MVKMFGRWWLLPFLALMALGITVILVVGIAAVVTYPTLPALGELTNYQPKIPLRIYSSDGKLLGEFGEERRALVKIQAVPKLMKDAILAAEDERFYTHGGVDYVGVLRAAYSNFVSGGVRQGASTITMQVARNFFLSKEKTLKRKFSEALLAFKIEHSLNKDEILQLYVNQIYLGQRAYGFAAAAQTYFGKNLEKLSLGEIATLAGLPKAPSTSNPISNLGAAKRRQQYVLRRMRELNFISEGQFQEAMKQPLVVVKHQQQEFAVKAEYVAEMVRQVLYEQYHEDAYAKGFRVYTTLNSKHQEAAYQAVRKGVEDYDRRHGYRGAESYVELPDSPSDENLEEALADIIESDEIYPAVVLKANAKMVKAYRKGGETLELSGDALRFAQRMLGDKANPARRIRPGAIIRVQKSGNDHWQIVQLPLAEAALVSLNPDDGAIKALIGGYDFNRNKFNHVTQAYRQPGSSFKPFIYSAALEKGFTPATIINDAPLVFGGNPPWEPKNFDGSYSGPIRLRTALTKSKNLVSIRILQSIGTQYAQDYITRFGFDPRLHPPYLTMALGAGSVTPWQMGGAYAVFANGGYKVNPYFIERIEDYQGNVLAQYKPTRAGNGADKVIDARNAFIMTSLLKDVVRKGTGARAMQLGRNDLAGKTGTTNDQVDAWFAGYQPTLVAVAWIGFDTPRSLGNMETGAQAALPIWMSYMGKVLKGVPDETPAIPDGISVVAINPETGLRTFEGSGMTEYFYLENTPVTMQTVNPDTESPPNAPATGPSTPRPTEEVKDQLF